MGRGRGRSRCGRRCAMSRHVHRGAVRRPVQRTEETGRRSGDEARTREGQHAGACVPGLLRGIGRGRRVELRLLGRPCVGGRILLAVGRAVRRTCGPAPSDVLTSAGSRPPWSRCRATRSATGRPACWSSPGFGLRDRWSFRAPWSWSVGACVAPLNTKLGSWKGQSPLVRTRGANRRLHLLRVVLKLEMGCRGLCSSIERMFELSADAELMTRWVNAPVTSRR